MGQRAERTPRGRSARAGQDDLPKRKPNLKKMWPQIRAVMARAWDCWRPAWC